MVTDRTLLKSSLSIPTLATTSFLLQSVIILAAMPRSKEREGRKRVAKACTLCQANKTKCDGLCPCGQCVKRETPISCAYSSHKRLYGRQRRWPKDIGTATPKTAQSDTADVENPQLSRSDSQGLRDHDEQDQLLATHIAITKLPNIMRDTKGRASMYSPLSRWSMPSTFG
jgi:hypothetical protein